MEKVMHKAEEQIKKKMHSGNNQHQQGGYVSLANWHLTKTLI